MGDSLLTAATTPAVSSCMTVSQSPSHGGLTSHHRLYTRPIAATHPVSIPFSWGTHFSQDLIQELGNAINEVSIPFSWGAHFSLSSWKMPSREWAVRLNPLLMGDSLLTRRRKQSLASQTLRVSIPFSWGTHFSLWKSMSSPASTESLNPLLMGHSLLTDPLCRLKTPLPLVSIPFSWGTHFSQMDQIARWRQGRRVVSIPFSWGTHFSPEESPDSIVLGGVVSIPFSWGTHFSHNLINFTPKSAKWFSLNPLLMGDSLLTRAWDVSETTPRQMSQSPSHGGLTSQGPCRLV